MIKFLHAADLHLDAPFSALSPEQAAARRQEQRALLTELAEAANAQDCDVVLLAGDLFDSSSASEQTLLALRRALASISATSAPVAASSSGTALPAPRTQSPAMKDSSWRTVFTGAFIP